MAISETKMQMVIDNYFKDECDVNTSIRQAFEKGFRIGVKKGASVNRPQGEWIDIGTISHSYKCSVCGRTLFHITVGKNHVAKYYPYCHCGACMKGIKDE